MYTELPRQGVGAKEGVAMRIVLGTICLILAATPAFATAAPAPLLGVGIPAATIVGGVLFGSRFFKKK